MFSAEQSGEGEARPTDLTRTVKGSETGGGAARSAQREDTAPGGDDAAGGAPRGSLIPQRPELSSPIPARGTGRALHVDELDAQSHSEG